MIGAGATPTPSNGGAAGDTYEVQSGDSCSSIATSNDLTLDEFFELNPDIDEDCTNLQPGDEVNVS